MKKHIDALVQDKKIPTKFSAESLDEAEKIDSTLAGANANRTDISRPLITIDGESAHDFDDAVYCEQRPDGTLVLFVAIADVSAGVERDSALDREARVRGNSVYLPDRVIPMLPPVLSENTFSLVPDQKRCCVVCEMEILDGEIKDYRFYAARMKSAARMSYRGLSEILAQAESVDNPALLLLAQAAQALRHRRTTVNRGMMLDRDGQECRLQDGKFSIERVKRGIADWIVEEAMIAANCCAGEYLARRNIPALYRVHHRPLDEKITRLNFVLSRLNISFPARPEAFDYGALVERVEQQNPALAEVLLPFILGTLSRAVYTPDNTGHFGLGYEHYLHFTSPIRRYPDLVNHRQLLAAINNEPPVYQKSELAEIGEHCSATEVRADKLEWECIRRFMCIEAKKVEGCRLTAFVSGVSKTGLYAAIPQLGVDGMIKFSALNGYWKQHDTLPCVIRESDGERLAIGDEIDVELVRVTPDKGWVDLELPAYRA